MKKTPKSFIEELKKILQEKREEMLGNQNLNLAETVRSMREAKGLSGVELCRKSGTLDPRTLTAVEKGRIKNPSVETLQALARGMGVTVSSLFRQAELNLDRYFWAGSQKGAFQIDFGAWGIKVVSFTPLVHEFFYGKFIFSGKKKLEDRFLHHPYPVFVTVASGRFEVRMESRKMQIREGESLFFHGSFEYSITNLFQRESVLFLMTAPSII